MLCCAALGGVVGVSMAFVAEQLSEKYENVLIREEMSAEMTALIADFADDDANEQLPHSPWKSLYIDRTGQPPTSPVALRGYPPGVHELDDSLDSDRFVGIRQIPAGRVTMVAGLPNSPARDRRFAEELLAMIGLGIVLGAWLGRLLARLMLAPVLRLAAAVDSDPPDQSLQRIADQHATDEVGLLSDALVRYRRRSQLAIEREMLFSADAGHELRTPLCVLQNGLELMGETQPGSARLQRMRASADEIATLLDALLLAGRSEEGQVAEPSSLELCAVIEMATTEFSPMLADAGIRLDVHCVKDSRIAAPPLLLRTVLRLLLRSVANAGFGAHVRLHADAQAIRIQQADADASPATHTSAASDEIGVSQSASAPRSDVSTGFGLLRRLCARYGWSLQLPDTQSSGSEVILQFSPAADLLQTL